MACLSQDDAGALATIARKSQIPVIADIHFQPQYVFDAIEVGCAAVRVNPWNIKQFDDKRLLQKYGKATPWSSRRCGRRRSSKSTTSGTSKISLKHNDPVVMIEAYRELAERCDFPVVLAERPME